MYMSYVLDYLMQQEDISNQGLIIYPYVTVEILRK